MWSLHCCIVRLLPLAFFFSVTVLGRGSRLRASGSGLPAIMIEVSVTLVMQVFVYYINLHHNPFQITKKEENSKSYLHSAMWSLHCCIVRLATCFFFQGSKKGLHHMVS
jgi:hypothetical protein